MQLVNVLCESTASKSDSTRPTAARDYNRSPKSPHVFRVRSDAAIVSRVMIFVALLRTGPGSLHLTQKSYGWLDGKAALTMKVSRHRRIQKLNPWVQTTAFVLTRKCICRVRKATPKVTPAPFSMSSKSVPFGGVQLHRAVGFKQVEFKWVFDVDERDTAISNQRLGLIEGRAENRVLHGVCPFHFVACFISRHEVGKTSIEMGVPCHMLPKPLNHGS